MKEYENKLIKTAVGYIEEDAKNARKLEDIGNVMTVPVELITPTSEAFDPDFTDNFNDFLVRLIDIKNDASLHMQVKITQPTKEELTNDFQHANIVITFVYTGALSDGDKAIGYLTKGAK